MKNDEVIKLMNGIHRVINVGFMSVFYEQFLEKAYGNSFAVKPLLGLEMKLREILC